MAAASLAGAAAIHAGVTFSHLREWPAGGLFLLALAGSQALLALQVAGTSAWKPRALSVVVSAIAISVWVASRTAGVPFGPHAGAAEAVGLADISATLLEGLTIAVLVAPTTGRVRTAAAMGVLGMALCGGIVSAVALGSPALAGADHHALARCPAHSSPASYLDHSIHRDPLASLRHESPERAHRTCRPTE